jgi:HEAT repeat protein
MKRRRTILIALLILVLGVVAGATLFDPANRVRGWVGGEPFYQGRAASAWRNDLADPDEQKATAARDALTAGKADAVPMCEWLIANSPDSKARWRAVDALGRMGKDVPAAGPPLAAALADPDPLVRAVATRSVGEFAPDVPGAVPALVRLFPDVDAIRSVASFKAAGGEAVPQLIGLLRHEDSVVRWNAARTLGKIGLPATIAIPNLIAIMEADPEALVREHGAEALGDIGPAAAEAVPALAKALKDPAPKVRRDAVRSLGQIGPLATPVLGEVRALMSDPEPIVREAAVTAARRIDPKGAEKK